jgi:hypothetical protein
VQQEEELKFHLHCHQQEGLRGWEACGTRDKAAAPTLAL